MSAPSRHVRLGGFFPACPDISCVPLLHAEAALRRSIDVVLWFQAWGNGDHGEFHPEWLPGCEGRTLVLTWEPWDPSHDALQPEFSLQAIADGAHDAYVDRWAERIAAWGKEIYLRPMHEMNGTWYPWGGAANGNSAEEYVRAWYYLQKRFRAAGASNVKWVWAVNANDVPEGNYLESYYPGSEAVDILGIDGYNAYGVHDGTWRTFEQIFGDPYRRLAALGTQPIWITEVGCASSGGDKALWVREMLKWLARHPRVDTLIWFNADKETDWRITEDPRVAQELWVW